MSPLAEKNVIIYADEQAFAALDGKYPYLEHATEDSFGTEFMDYKLAIKTVASLEEALDHIDANGSGHSESIITMDEAAARKFQAHVDAACVYWNAPTSFRDRHQHAETRSPWSHGARRDLHLQMAHRRRRTN